MSIKASQILLVNDDGIESPGLWAAAQALADLGQLTIVAPRDQSSGAGRSMPSTSDGIIQCHTIAEGGKEWKAYSVGGTPAQAVLHATLEIMSRLPDLVVSGINYGENLGGGVTVSGTVGAALEGAAAGIPSLAVSLQTAISDHFGYSRKVDFSTSQFFTRYFSKLLLERRLPFDVDVLKIDIPANASSQTPWEVTRLARNRYYQLTAPGRSSWAQPGKIKYNMISDLTPIAPDTDIYALLVKQVVSVTPLSLDLTSRVDLKALEEELRGGRSG